MSLAIFLCVGEQAFPQVETSVAPLADIYALKWMSVKIKVGGKP